MKKSVFLLFCILCASAALAQSYGVQSYPVPTLIEGTAPGFVSELPGTQPQVTQPSAFVPSKHKRECAVDCLLTYKHCVRDGSSVEKCRNTEYRSCMASCPNQATSVAGGPEIAFPGRFSGRADCIGECRTAYDFCMTEGGSVNVCSKRVLNPCTQECAREFSVPERQSPIPPNLSCMDTCGFKFRQCEATGSAGCGAMRRSCVQQCPGYVAQDVMSPERPKQPGRLEEVGREQSCGAQCGAAFEACYSAGNPLYACQNSVIDCLNGCVASRPERPVTQPVGAGSEMEPIQRPVEVERAGPKSAQDVEPVVRKAEPSWWERIVVFLAGE